MRILTERDTDIAKGYYKECECVRQNNRERFKFLIPTVLRSQRVWIMGILTERDREI